jgi:hypothetical protein
MIMKGTPGEKEQSERHMRTHQISGGGRQYRKMVSSAMYGQRPVRTALFVNSPDPATALLLENGNPAVQSLAVRRSMSGSVEKLTLRSVPIEIPSPVKPTYIGDRSQTLTPVDELGFDAAFFHTSQPCPAGITSRHSTRSPSSPGYAGAKFSEAPSPKVLPKPPVHWVDKSGSGAVVAPSSCGFSGTCHEMTNALKGLLKVQC